MKKIMLLLAILVCAVTNQAQTAMVTQTDIVQKAVYAGNKWVWGKQTNQNITVIVDGGNIIFENQAHTKLKLISDCFRTEDDKMIIFKYYAKESKGQYCTFKIVKWKADDQVQFYLIYDKEQFVFTASLQQE